ncbi:hypothetical protein HJFPF1_02096 [Paramyrothecium foliicola]|nr:hypothetical protein HJFPF1_02096 [Paramyrothecium foliicola]
MEGHRPLSIWPRLDDKAASQAPSLRPPSSTSYKTPADHADIPPIDFGALDFDIDLPAVINRVARNNNLDTSITAAQQTANQGLLGRSGSRPQTAAMCIASTSADDPSDLPLRRAKDQHQQPRKTTFRQRFWALSGSNSFSHDKNGEKTTISEDTASKRMIYVPKHAAADFSALSPGVLRTPLSQASCPRSSSLRSRTSSSSTRTGPSPLSATTMDSESPAARAELPEKKEDCGHKPSEPEQAPRLDDLNGPARNLLQRSLSNMSTPSLSTRFPSTPPQGPLPPTPQDFALFAAQARSFDRSDHQANAAAAWAALVRLQNAQTAGRRRSLDSVASSSTAVHPQLEQRQRHLSMAHSDGSVTLGRPSLAMGAEQAAAAAAVVKRIQQQHGERVAQGQRGFGQRIAAYIRPTRVEGGHLYSRR